MHINAIERALLRLREELNQRDERIADIQHQLEMAKTTEELSAVCAMLKVFNNRGDEISEELDYWNQQMEQFR